MSNTEIERIYQCFLESEQRICTDTRKEASRSIFFCLKGNRFDANLFAENAIKNGANYVVTNRKDLTDAQILYSENPNQTLIDLAHFHSKRIHAKFIAVGGSNGKTTTKELIHCVLSKKYRTGSTKGNYNNDIGVPLTILGFNEETEIGIVELGTNHPGEMKILCEIFTMDSGLLTNIGLEHLEGFQDLETVAKEESELYLRAQQDSAMVFVNADDPWLSNMSKRLKFSKTYSILDSNSDIYIKINQEMPQLELEWNHSELGSHHFKAEIGGQFNASNIAAAISVGLYYNVEVSQIIDAVSHYKPTNNRSQWIKDIQGIEILLDAYNANPSSVEQGLKSFSLLPGRKTILLGDMLELGDHSLNEHQKVFELATKLGFNEIFFVGNEFKKSVPQYPFVFDHCESLLAWLDTHPIKEGYVYIKGSRGISMEKCLEHFSIEHH